MAQSVCAHMQVLKNLNEHPMVRHEAAEALGAIATLEAMDLLGQFLTDNEPAVKESCVVGWVFLTLFRLLLSKSDSSLDL